MRIPQWLFDVLQANESKALDSPQDRHSVALQLAHGVDADRSQLVEQIAVWLDGRGENELAHYVRRGDWT